MPTITCNDAQIAYDDVGQGDQSFVLLHGGAFCDRRYMAPLTAHFATRGRVVVPDLRGHGRSERVGRISNEQFADDTADLCRALGLQRPVVIGHSSGGHAALELAVRHPEVARALVLLDSGPLVWPEEQVTQNRGLAGLLRSANGAAVLREVANAMLPASEPFDGRDALLASVAECDPTVFADLIESDLEWDGVAVAAACPSDTPLLALVSDHPYLDLEELQRLCPHAMVGRTVGSHHFHQLVVPDQVIAMIERFLAVACER